MTTPSADGLEPGKIKAPTRKFPGFYIEHRGRDWILIWPQSGCGPASPEVLKLWNMLPKHERDLFVKIGRKKRWKEPQMSEAKPLDGQTPQRINDATLAGLIRDYAGPSGSMDQVCVVQLAHDLRDARAELRALRSDLFLEKRRSEIALDEYGKLKFEVEALRSQPPQAEAPGPVALGGVDMSKEIAAVRSYIARSAPSYLEPSNEKREQIHEMAEWGLSRLQYYFCNDLRTSPVNATPKESPAVVPQVEVRKELEKWKCDIFGGSNAGATHWDVSEMIIRINGILALIPIPNANTKGEAAALPKDGGV